MKSIDRHDHLIHPSKGILKPCRLIAKSWFLLFSCHRLPNLLFLLILVEQVPSIQSTENDHYNRERKKNTGGECVARRCRQRAKQPSCEYAARVSHDEPDGNRCGAARMRRCVIRNPCGERWGRCVRPGNRKEEGCILNMVVLRG